MNQQDGRELHELLRELVERQGAGVIETPEAFRAALDDFLSEDEATLGELNLLGDAVRLGAVDRLLSMLDHGADPHAAVAEAGDTLARDRGTEDQRRTRWAVAAVGYATGRISEPVVAAYRTGAPPSVPAPPATVEPPAQPAPPPTPPPSAPPAPETAVNPGFGPGTLSGRSVDADTWDQQRQAPAYPPPVPTQQGRRRAWPVVLAVLVLLLAGGGVLAWVLTQDDDSPSDSATDDPTDNPTDEPTDEPTETGPIDVTSNTVLVPIKRDGSSKIYAVDPDDPDSIAPITPGDNDNFPAISPDRESIVYLARATDDAVWPIVLDVATGASHQLFDSEDACDYARRPAFSPDGQRLALNCIDAEGQSTGMFIVDPGGGLDQAIEVEGVVRGTPTWVSQTQLVASVADSEDSPSSLWLYDIQTKVAEQLTFGEGWDTHPDWVSGPELLLFVRSESEEPTGELWTMPIDGEPEQVDVGQPVLDPVWSPGGTEIAFRTEDDTLATVLLDDPGNVVEVPGTEDVSGPPVWGDR
ncbi:MAG TPA: hypothetical protein VFO49_11125 [Nocardioides sp.]|nr:hypothetical protein [Nocardioides sp.]